MFLSPSGSFYYDGHSDDLSIYGRVQTRRRPEGSMFENPMPFQRWLDYISSRGRGYLGRHFGRDSVHRTCWNLVLPTAHSAH
ncbi:MAG: hypothetical protein Ct9H300mP27_10190 [Chloroflexota bacterium]|nr:MAG: hypothetical protein Ct9H300mP27_10190 [Chloroflexota bacterium]